MFAKLSDAKDRTVDFARRHRTAITITATTLVCYKVHRGAVQSWNEFLEEKGLTDEFYNPED